MIRTIPTNFSKSNNPKHIYTGLQPAITGIGGFSIEEDLQVIRLNPVQNIGKYNTTDAIQLLYDTSKINNKIGLVKQGNCIVHTTYNECTHSFPIDSISVTANDFINNLRIKQQINSIGSLECVYRDFIDYVNQILNYEEGFSSIYLLDQQFDINGGVFEIDDFFSLIKSQETNCYGKYNNLFGSVSINGINKLLKSSTDLNIFGNRGIDDPPSQPTYQYGAKDGFLEGDLIYIPKGFTMTLSVDLDSETLKFNELGKQFIHRLNHETNYDNGNMSQETITTIHNITRTIKVPLLIKLIDNPYDICPIGPTGSTGPIGPSGHTGPYPRPPPKPVCIDNNYKPPKPIINIPPKPPCPTGHTGPGPTGHTGPCPTGHTGPGPTGHTGPCPTGHTGPCPTGHTGPCPTGHTGPGPTGPTGPNCYPKCKQTMQNRQTRIHRIGRTIDITNQLLNNIHSKNNDVCVKKNTSGNMINIFINNGSSNGSINSDTISDNKSDL
jgi:hypothetical protein